jgi:drug/metabolite transporter (DMT)-like permease
MVQVMKKHVTGWAVAIGLTAAVGWALSWLVYRAIVESVRHPASATDILVWCAIAVCISVALCALMLLALIARDMLARRLVRTSELDG